MTDQLTDSTALRPDARARRRLHPAWIVAAVAFLTLVGAAAFRAVPGILLDPLHEV